VVNGSSAVGDCSLFLVSRLHTGGMTSSDSLEKNKADIGEVYEQQPCLSERSVHHPTAVGRQSSVTQRARRYWQQIRRLLLFDILSTASSLLLCSIGKTSVYEKSNP